MPKRVHLVLKTHHDALKMLSKAKGQRFKIIMENTPEMVKAIQVLFRYILNSRLKLQDKHVNKLKPHKNYIRKIARASHKAIKEPFKQVSLYLERYYQLFCRLFLRYYEIFIGIN